MLKRNLQLSIFKRLLSYTPQSINKPKIVNTKVNKNEKIKNKNADAVNNSDKTVTYSSRRKLVYNIPESLKSLSVLPKLPTNNIDEKDKFPLDLKESEITSTVIGANNDIIRYAISEGIHTGLKQRQEFVSPVYEDDNLNKDDVNQPMTDATAQK